MDDPYLIPGSQVLRNLLGATTSVDLAAAEADLSFARAVELMDRPVTATNDLHELKTIHRRLFQDVYDWAGHIRIIDVRKDVPGADFFMPWVYIPSAAERCFAELSDEQFLQKLPRRKFIERLAFHYEKINYVHPFREGNGRVQRIYWNRVALDAGWQLDWRSVHGQENHEAARAGSDQLDLQPLIDMFEKVVAEPTGLDSSDWRRREIERLSIGDAGSSPSVE